MTAPKFVTLTDRNNGEVKVSHPADIVNLVYGQGYKVKGGKTPEEATAYLASQGEADSVQAAAAPEAKPSK